MNDDRLRARVRHAEGPTAPRPEFVEALHDDLAARLGLTPNPASPEVTSDANDVAGVVGRGRGPIGRRMAGGRLRRTWILVAAALMLLAAAGAIGGVGSLVIRWLDQPTLLESITRAGALRIEVRPDHPQVGSTSGALDGFDLAVASAIADRMGVRLDPVVAPAGEVPLPGRSGTVAAMPSRAIPGGEVGGVVATVPYYRWPILVAVRQGTSEPTTLEDLAGRRICVVEGSGGEAWAKRTGEAAGVEALRPVPPDVTTMPQPGDDRCLDALAAGTVDAAVTARLLAGDLATSGIATPLPGGPVAREPAAILVALGRGAGGLRDQLDAVLDDLRSDGTLSSLSRQWFGGEDLTRP